MSQEQEIDTDVALYFVSYIFIAGVVLFNVVVGELLHMQVEPDHLFISVCSVLFCLPACQPVYSPLFCPIQSVSPLCGIVPG